MASADFVELFEFLQIDEDLPSVDVVKMAFKKASLSLHPDKGGSSEKVQKIKKHQLQ